MRSRCKPQRKQAHSYFGRGIQVCPEWRDDAEAFCVWAYDNGFGPELELDRIDNDLTGERAYSPENCRWVTRAVNQQNRKGSYWWIANGKRYASCREVSQDLEVALSVAMRWFVGRGKTPPRPGFERVLKYPDD